MFVETMSYFIAWGVAYGLLLGGVTGTAVFPLIGTIAGVIVGAVGGVIGGIIAGVTAAMLDLSQIDLDTDLDLYGRLLVRRVATAVVLVPLIAWSVGSFLIRGVIGLGVLLPLALPWAAFSAAYVARCYPDVVARRLYKGKRGALLRDDESFLRPQPSLSESWALLVKSGSRKLRGLLGGVALAWLHLQTLLIYTPPSTSLPPAKFIEVFFIGIIGVFVAEVLWSYVTLANTLLVTFLKRLVLQDYFSYLPAQWHRRILTGTAFLLTVPLLWWIFLLKWWTAPLTLIVAAMTAYDVHHTLALPDMPLGKAKRKEKNTLALVESEHAEDDAQMQDEELIVRQQQR